MPTVQQSFYSQLSLTGYKWAECIKREDYNPAANTVIALGQVVAQVVAANAIDVQTLSNTATGGTFTLTFGGAQQYSTGPLAATTLTAAQLQTALQAIPNIGPGGATVTGGPFTSGGGSLTITFAGQLANQPQPLMVINNGLATGGSVTIAHTTQGVANGSIVPYNGAIVADPTAAPSLTGAGTDGTFDVGAQTVAYTYVTAGGESRPGAEAGITLTSTQHIAVATINSIPTGVTGLNFYVNGYLATSKTVSAGSVTGFNILAPAATTSPTPPTVSTAYLNGDGSQIPIGLAWMAMATAPNGAVTEGSAPTGNEYGGQIWTGNVAIAGYFLCSLINSGAGPDQNTVNKLGRLVSGSLTTGVFVLYGA